MILKRISHKGIMKKGFLIKIAVLFIIYFTLFFPSSADADSSNYIAGEILIKYSANATLPEIADFEKLHNLTVIKIYLKFKFYHYALPENIDVSKAIKLFSSYDIIEHVAPNHTRAIHQLPTDPRFPEQWSLNNTGQVVNGRQGFIDADIDLPEALEIYSGSKKVIVAVIDSGVALDHPEIFRKIWWNSGELVDGEVKYNGIDDDGNGYIDDLWGWDFYDSDNLPWDENGHGTLVSSIIAGVGDNSEGGIGIAQHASIMSLRIFNDWGRPSNIYVSDVLNALEYALNNGAEIINCSFGGSNYNPIEYDAIEVLKTNGVIIVASAGNGGYDRKGDDNDIMPIYPASYDLDNIVSVASTNENDKLSYFSNVGITSVDIAAPGENIFGAIINRKLKWVENFESGAPGWQSGVLPGNLSPYSWSLYEDSYSNMWITDSVDSWYFPVNYTSFTNTYAVSPPILLGIGSQLHYRAWYRLSFFDHVVTEISLDGLNWEIVDKISGYSYGDCPSCSGQSGTRRTADISKYDLQIVNIRFRLISDFLFEGDGIYIDDLWITEVDVFGYDGTQYDFVKGTSFSAPIVSGVLALINSERPDLDYLTIINIMLNNSDSLATLDGKVSSGGRVNAYSSLLAAKEYPVQPPPTPTPTPTPSPSGGGGGGCFISTIYSD